MNHLFQLGVAKTVHFPGEAVTSATGREETSAMQQAARREIFVG
jgi:hypothetical protein